MGAVQNIKVVFEPEKGSQSLALSCPCNEILYEGTRGPGKTAIQLMRFRRLVGTGYGSYWKGVIFDKEYKNLGDLVAQSTKLFTPFGDGAVFLRSKSDYYWQWPTGEQLLFRTGSTIDDYWNYHGQEFPFIGFNELTKQADPEFYESMFSCMRSSFIPEENELPGGILLPSIPLEAFSTTNPYGAGHSWVKKRFIDPVPRGTIQKEVILVPNPKTQKDEEVVLTKVAIHGSWRENSRLDPKYIAFLMSIKDPNKKAAWVDGSWDITSGGRFDHLWDAGVHIMPSFKIPSSWSMDRAHDWGESKPFSNLWFAQSDGTEARLSDGSTFCPPANTLILIGEWYGCEPEEMNKGIQLSSTKVGKGVKYLDKLIEGQQVDMPDCFKDGMPGQVNITGNIGSDIWPGPADSSIFNTNTDEHCIADNFAKEGVKWRKSDKSPGSRINGATIICDRLEASLDAMDSESGVSEKPGFYVFENCRGFISRFPILARDDKKPDDVDTEQEDHDYDAFRYRVLTKAEKPAMNVKVKWAT